MSAWRNPAHGGIEERDDFELTGRAAVQMGDEMQVRKAVEVTQAGLELRANLNPRPNRARGHRLQRHSLDPRERRAHDADRTVGDRREKIVGFHGGRAYRVVDYGPRGWASTGFAPSLLILEITEGLLADDPDALVRPSASVEAARGAGRDR